MNTNCFLLHQLLRRSAQQVPEKGAVWDNGQWYTYGYLDARSNQVARLLMDLGIKRQDRIAILLENSIDYVVFYFGILKAGAVAVPLDTRPSMAVLEYLLCHCDARLLVTNKRFANVVNKVLGQAQGLDGVAVVWGVEAFEQGYCRIIDVSRTLQGLPQDPIDDRCIDLDLAMIVYTSGSTGQPKGVMLSHLNLLSNTRSIVQYLKITDSDRILVILPFFYIYGKSLLQTHIAVGGSVVIENRLAFPKLVLRTMQELEVTGFAGVPSTFMILLRYADLSGLHLPRLRYITQAGGHMPASVRQRVAQAFAPAGLYIMYGTTEAGPRLTYLNPWDLDRKIGSVGRPIPNVEICIVDQSDRPVGPGQVGQVVARGSNIMVGYWKDPQVTAQVLKGGWLHTGDLGWIDQDGYLYLLGRDCDIVKVGGVRISLQQIEDALLEIPGVYQAAAVAVEDELMGNTIEAYVVADQDLHTDQSIRKALADRLGRSKLPSRIHLCKDLPVNTAGKVLKSKLTQPYIG